MASRDFVRCTKKVYSFLISIDTVFDEETHPEHFVKCLLGGDWSNLKYLLEALYVNTTFRDMVLAHSTSEVLQSLAEDAQATFLQAIQRLHPGSCAATLPLTSQAIYDSM
jgi:hypothetical protein